MRLRASQQWLTIGRLGRLPHDDEPTSSGVVRDARLLARALAWCAARDLFSADRLDLLDEGRDLRREINRLADDYNAHWSLTAEEGDHDAAAKAIEKRAQTTADKKPNDEKEDLDNDEVERKPK